MNSDKNMGPKSINKNKLLLGEGKEEEIFFKAILLSHLGIEDIQPYQYGGKNNLRNVLSVLKKEDGFENVVSIGVTCDADQAPAASFDSVVDALNDYDLPAPSEPGQYHDGDRRVGIYMFPDNGSEGELETLCLEAISGRPVVHCVEELFECANENGFYPKKPSKARVYAWLTTRREFHRELGIAAQNDQIPFEDDAFDPFCEFVSLL